MNTDTETIVIYPVDEGFKAGKNRNSIHTNPYKAPNVPRTDDVKSEAWLVGFQNGLLS